MSLLADNMRFLRGRRGLSQQRVADDLIITRSRYAKYEEGASEPPIELLQRISRYFHVSIDLLVGVDLQRSRVEELLKLPDYRMVLPVK
ncbi:DNA-binding transcriptional regulator, XRE-family HTH domain [Sphingobacterium nematocida]|uniref:DNA-binding transcriptional regulator, XRE-family HTH domain n=1 Tax=Sphingobacterium nematocida TaxID=1513896 RepID=A0A1T5B161_9SPHI|nr:helix-turn-helix transcriptional regulator [Sphingobacterium nematocida]SKB40807.1 DNA-binding transcriptional regulator, XRE-family HTH domain [Sphingobacterium nematocida]